VIFAEPLHQLVGWFYRDCLHDTEHRQKQEAAQKIQHGAMRYGHHRHLPVIQGTVISESRNTGSNLTTQMHRLSLSGGEDVLGHARTIPTAPKADYCTEDRATQLHRKVEKRQNHGQSNSAVQRPRRDHRPNDDRSGDAGQSDYRG
jgi:hypothetical protein